MSRSHTNVAEGQGRSYNSPEVFVTTQGSEHLAERLLPIQGFRRFSTFRDYDITPDGQRFLVVMPADETVSDEPTAPQINVILNWFEELKERVRVP